MTQYTPGQRWISEAEPELGLGTVLRVEDGRVGILFSASGDMRQYSVGERALEARPVSQGRLRSRAATGASFTVVDVEEDGRAPGLPRRGRGTLPEAQLSDSISFQQARGKAACFGQVDEPPALRFCGSTPWSISTARGKSQARGFVGGRHRPHPASALHRPRSDLAAGAANPAGRRSGPGQDHRGRPDPPSLSRQRARGSPR